LEENTKKTHISITMQNLPGSCFTLYFHIHRGTSRQWHQWWGHSRHCDWSNLVNRYGDTGSLVLL